MAKFEGTATRANMWSALVERCLKMADAFGLSFDPKSLLGTVITGCLWAGAMIYQHVPWYILVPVVILFAGSALHLFGGIARALSVRGIKPLDLSVPAAACERLEERYWDYLIANEAEVVAAKNWHMVVGDPNDPNDFRKRHDEARIREEAFIRKLQARFGSDVVAVVAMLRALGLKADSDFRSLHWLDMQMRYYGAVGKLLKAGLLEEARKLDPYSLPF